MYICRGLLACCNALILVHCLWVNGWASCTVSYLSMGAWGWSRRGSEFEQVCTPHGSQVELHLHLAEGGESCARVCSSPEFGGQTVQQVTDVIDDWLSSDDKGVCMISVCHNCVQSSEVSMREPRCSGLWLWDGEMASVHAQNALWTTVLCNNMKLKVYILSTLWNSNYWKKNYDNEKRMLLVMF